MEVIKVSKQVSKPEKRSFNFKVRAEGGEEKGNVIVGRPIVYDSKTDLGWCYEIIERGALDNCNLTDIIFSVNHDINKIPLARYREGYENNTMQVSVDADGMTIKIILDTENNADARALYSAVQRGDISGMSFIFTIENEEIEDEDTEHPTVHIKSISEVLEVSAVTFPAYDSTEIDARSKVKKSDDEKSDENKKKLELLKEKTKILGGI